VTRSGSLCAASGNLTRRLCKRARPGETGWRRLAAAGWLALYGNSSATLCRWLWQTAPALLPLYSLLGYCHVAADSYADSQPLLGGGWRRWLVAVAAAGVYSAGPSSFANVCL